MRNAAVSGMILFLLNQRVVNVLDVTVDRMVSKVVDLALSESYPINLREAAITIAMRARQLLIQA